MIQRPRRLSYDWHGAEGDEPRVGSFLRTPTGRTYYVTAARRVAVQVSRGETLRLMLTVIVWDDATPPGRVYDLFWNSR